MFCDGDNISVSKKWVVVENSTKLTQYGIIGKCKICNLFFYHLVDMNTLILLVHNHVIYNCITGLPSKNNY